jgi:hypothetical protein
MKRRHLLFVLVGVFASFGAGFRTTNFVVHAPTNEIAQQVGQYAEHYRREKAIEWLGQEMPTWPQPCPLHVQVTMDGPSGATSFNFGQGRVLGMKMEIQGPLDRLLASVLPHEITHTVFAHYFRCPVPRWADEGGSVLSEDDVERDRHDKLTRQILNNGRQIPLRRLMGLKEYPREVVCLYAQGYSMSDYLVKRSNRQTFLRFVHAGMQQGWDQAVQTYYQHRSVEELEETWLSHLRETKGQPHLQLAKNRIANPAGNPSAKSAMVVRLTAPPTQPLDPAPIVRGAAPSPEQTGQRFGDRPAAPPVQPLQPFNPHQPPPPGGGWQPVFPQPPVFLGPPQTGTPVPHGMPTSYPR